MFGVAALTGLNHLLRDASWARARLAPHAGRTVRVVLPLALRPWCFDFAIDETGLLVASDIADADVEIELPADAPVLALAGPDALLKSVMVRGAADLAEALNFVLPRLRWDMEEDLSRLVGDIAAHRMVQGIQGMFAWQRVAGQRLAQNLAEYLTEEQPLLASRAAMASFSAELAQLAISLEALEARAARLASGTALA